MKDWIEDLEEKRKQEELEIEQRRKEEEDKRTRFVPVKEKLLPILDARIAEIKQRTGIVITMVISDTVITARQPHYTLSLKFEKNYHFPVMYQLFFQHCVCSYLSLAIEYLPKSAKEKRKYCCYTNVFHG